MRGRAFSDTAHAQVDGTVNTMTGLIEASIGELQSEMRRVLFSSSECSVLLQNYAVAVSTGCRNVEYVLF